MQEEREGKIQEGAEMQEVEKNECRMQEEEKDGEENARRGRDAGS